jgi:hypothetical protein
MGIWTSSPYLAQKLSQHHEEAHQVPRVIGEDPLRITPAHVLGSSAHCGRNDFARRVHEQLGKPFEHLLNDLRVRFLQVCDVEIADADVLDASRDLSVVLGASLVKHSVGSAQRIPVS